MCLLAASFGFGAATAFWVSRLHISNMLRPEVTIQQVSRRDALVLSVPEHSPLSQSMMYNVAIDYDGKYLDVSEIRIVWNPISQVCVARPPIVIQAGLLPGCYMLRYWSSGEFIPIGNVTVDERYQLTWNGTVHKSNERLSERQVIQ